MTDEIEAKAENCRLAMKAALEAIQDYCGTGETSRRAVIQEGLLKIEIPDKVYSVLKSYRDEKWPFSTLYSYLMTETSVVDMSNQICILQGDESQKCRFRVTSELVYKIITNEDLKPWIGTIDPDELADQRKEWTFSGV